MSGVPYTFGNATTTIALSNLDVNFATPATIGNTTVGLGNTVTTIGNLTLTNVNIASVTSAITPAEGGTGLTSFTANGLVYASSTSALATGSSLTWSGTALANNNATASDSITNTLYLQNSGATKAANFQIGNSNGVLQTWVYGGSSWVNATTIDASGTFYVGTTTQSSSNTGINVGSPNAGATSNLIAMQNRSTSNNSGVQIAFRGLTSGGSESDYGYINMVANDTSAKNSYMAFWTTNGGTIAERARIDNSGNLLVGTTNNVSSARINVAQGSSDGVMYQMMQFTGGSGTGGNEVGLMKRQTTASVSNSATTIESSLSFGELITVTGVGSGAIFADLLMASYNTVAVISSNTQQGSPASRTYSMSSGALRLTMGSSTSMAITVQSLICGARGA